jgi:hypothetical protein
VARKIILWWYGINYQQWHAAISGYGTGILLGYFPELIIRQPVLETAPEIKCRFPEKI